MSKLVSFIIAFLGPISLWAQGGLFIIGGGAIPPELMEQMLQRVNHTPGAYAIILPMASEEPDSAVYFAGQRFQKANWHAVQGMFVGQQQPASVQQLDSLRGAALIYFTGGDQNRLMEASRQLGIVEAVHQAYQGGALIAGTSAGAAIMSKVMITGNQLRKADYEETYSALQAANVETAAGYGFLQQAVIDQHFIRRSRYNRLISLVIEQPALLGIGIDESTAIWVHRGKATVVGQAQVVLFRQKKSLPAAGTLLRSQRLEIQILSAGDTFKVR
ncbi:MAG: cyanophycinase [Bacteroidia bacterium]